VAPTTQTAFRLEDLDFAILDAVKQRMGFVARSDALRYVLREYARREGIEPGKPKPRKK
jgi:hypothetical protein